MLTFLREYAQWKKEHRKEIQEAKLRKEAMKQPLNYQLLDQLFQAFTERHDKDAVMEIKGLDFTIKCYYDNGGRYKRETTTEQILKQYK